MSSDEAVDISSFQRKWKRRTPPRKAPKAPSLSPRLFLSDNTSSDEEIRKSDHVKTSKDEKKSAPIVRTLVAVRPEPLKHRHLYKYIAPKDEVSRVIREYSRRGVIMYEVKLLNGTIEQVCPLSQVKSSLALSFGSDPPLSLVCLFINKPSLRTLFLPPSFLPASSHNNAESNRAFEGLLRRPTIPRQRLRCP